MARKGFLNGLLAGSLIGAVVGLIATPQKKPLRKNFIGKTRRAGARAQQVFHDVKDGIKDIKNILD